MNSVAVVRALTVAGLFRGQWALDDIVYDGVSTPFIAEAAREWVDEWLPPECTVMRPIGGGKTIRFPLWVKEAGDCDNIGKCFAAYLAVCQWAKAAKSGQPLGNLAAGIFRFVPDDAGGIGHLATWYIDHEEIAHVFDLQLMAERHLSSLELLSVYGGETI